MQFIFRFVALLATSILVVAGTSACSGDDKSSDAAANAANTAKKNLSTPEKAAAGTDTGNLGVSEDDFATAVASATGADKVEWKGKTLRIHFETGSVEDSTATINCSVVNTLIAKGSKGVVVYSDGELDCPSIIR